jgi:hypothetical protein
MGIALAKTVSIALVRPDRFIAWMPRSDRARLIDFVKFKGMVDGSRRSSQKPDSSISVKAEEVTQNAD